MRSQQGAWPASFRLYGAALRGHCQSSGECAAPASAQARLLAVQRRLCCAFVLAVCLGRWRRIARCLSEGSYWIAEAQPPWGSKGVQRHARQALWMISAAVHQHMRFKSSDLGGGSRLEPG